MSTAPMSGRVVLGRYRIVAPLARGGMGIIYLGRLEGAANFAKPVVIKTVIPDARDQRAAQMFAREARILSNLEHPSIVGVLDFGEVDGEYIMVLEYVHGFHLGNWWRYVREARGAMPVEHAVEAMLPVLDALDFAHRLTRADGTPLAIVHRDISPANILLDHMGNVKLHDFGIARMADDEFKTQDGSFRGTLSFTAPETLQGVAASPRSDLYACGVVLYQLLSGTNPFRGEQPSETLHRVVTHVPPRLASLRKDVLAPLDAAVAQAMEKDPSLRFDSAASFARALRAARSWSEEAAAADFVRSIQADFASAEMPEYLGIETLQSRDAAWRAAQPELERMPLRSSLPPARSARDGSTQTASVPPITSSATISGARQASAAPPLRPASAAPKRPLLFALGGVSVLLALGVVAYVLVHKNAEAPAPRFLLIEKQTDANLEPTPSATPTPVAPSSAVSVTALPTARKSTRSNDPAVASGSTLTAAFQKQRGHVEACFRSNQGEASTPQLNLRFQVDASGAVRDAQLSPPSVAGSALGACIIGVARATHFPASDAPVSFSIPITARKVGG